MSSVGELAEGLARRCRSIGGLTCHGFVHPAPETPGLLVEGPIRWTYDETFDGTWRPVFALLVLVSAADEVRAQQTLFTYLAPTGTRSIPAAIYGDPTLGGVANDTRVLGGPQPPVQLGSGGGAQLRAVLEVEVTAA